MPSAADRMNFGSRDEASGLAAFCLALVAHLLLVAALTWGVNWKRVDTSSPLEAEIWSPVQLAAAARAQEPQPPPPAPEPPAPAPPAPSAEPPPAPPAMPEKPDADIALEREALAKAKEQAAQQAAKAKADKLRQEQARLAATEAAQLAALKKIEQAQAQAAKNAQAAKTAQAALAAKNAQAAQTALAEQKQREESLKRIQGLADATGPATNTGSAQRSSGPAGPSSGYGARVRAKVKPNIVFTESIEGNNSAEVEVRSAPDGTIMSQRLVKSSGNKAWDDAVIKAIIRTDSMPRDVDGRVPTPMILEFKPRD